MGVKKLCSDNEYALVFDEISRAPLSDAEVNSKFNNLFWIKAYFLIRAIEKRKGSIKVDLRMKKVMQKINKIYFFLDNGPSAAIAYVNDILKQYY